MTRKKIGLGLLETFSEPCECCAGRGVVVHDEPRFRSQEAPKRGAKKKAEKPDVVKKVVTAEQADAAKDVFNKMAGAGAEAKEPEGKTELLNAVLEALPEPEPKAKPKSRRATSTAKKPRAKKPEKDK
jgi:ribonuclease E